MDLKELKERIFCWRKLPNADVCALRRIPLARLYRPPPPVFDRSVNPISTKGIMISIILRAPPIDNSSLRVRCRRLSWAFGPFQDYVTVTSLYSKETRSYKDCLPLRVYLPTFLGPILRVLTETCDKNSCLGLLMPQE